MRRALARVPRSAWIASCLLLLATLGYFGFHALFVKVGRSVEQPFSGPARNNTFYVFERYLEARGIKVQTTRHWPQTLGANTLVLWFSDEEVPLDLRRWLSNGGALWTWRDPDRSQAPHGWRETPWGDADAAPGDPELENNDEGSDVQRSCDEGCLAAAQFAYGEGCLTLVREHALHNERVSLGETPARIDALLRCPVRPLAALVVTDLSSPWFGTLLLEHAPEALWAALALLVLTLWRVGKHFGPRAATRSRARREMIEHIGAVGMLAARAGLGPLLAAARAQLRKQLLRRVPQGGSLSGAALVTAVATATQAPEHEVRRALLDELGGGGREAIEIARAVQALWRKI